jgi:phosphoenolpyruvate carboxykinase (GTP)
MGIPEDAYPIKGLNHSGEWYIGMTEDKVKGYQPKEGEAPKKIGIAHANARYTISLEDLENKDESLHDPNGVILDGILYGGRDSFTSVPVSQCFSWEHGVYTGATLESETTSAIINMPKTVRQDPMANIDFVVAPFGKYIDNHLKFGASLKRVPKVFSTNYFLKHPETGNFLNEKVDKRVWVLWAEGRVHNDYGAIETPIGFIPKYEDIANLFKRVFNRQYSKEDYVNQFSVRVQKYLEKCQRIEDVYKSEPNMPETFWKEHEALKERLNLFKEKTGKEIISPFDL